MTDIVITGIGVVTPSVVGAPALAKTAEEVFAGRGVEPPQGEVAGFDLSAYCEARHTYLDRASALGLAAIALALKDAAADGQARPDRMALSVGTAFGAPATFITCCRKITGKEMRFIQPMLFQHSFYNVPAALSAIQNSIKGANMNFCGSAAAGALAFLCGWDWIAAGKADGVVVLAADSVPAELSGTGLTEAACAIVLEPAAAAQQRGARWKARVPGCGLSCRSADAARSALAGKTATMGIHLGSGVDRSAGLTWIDGRNVANERLAAAFPLSVASAALAGCTQGNGCLVTLCEGKTCVATLLESC